MLKKKLMSLGIAVVFTLSSLTTTVFAADYNKASAGAKVTIKLTNPGKGNGNDKDKKNDNKKYKFDDIDGADIAWAINAIEKMASKGILGGIGQGKFAPRNNATQMEVLAMVLRLTGDSKEADSLGKKIHPKYNGIMPTWGQGYIYIAIEKGILLPEELKGFNPFEPAKRHEIAKYIIRAMGKTNEALKYMDEKLPFKDSKAVPEKSIGYVYLVNELKIMTGDDNNKFNPNVPVTRAQMAAILDRAEGKFDVPDTDTRKNGIVFVSADTDDNEITVKVKGSTVTYDIVEGTQVYKDGSFQDIDDLEPGDVLQLIFNADKKVIFIDVKGTADVDDDEDETELSIRTVSYNDLPEALQDEVDDLKSTKNYKAYEYGDYIYLLATLGKRSTGGYDIAIEKVYKVENDDDYILKAIVDIDEPDSDDAVTQSVTYPYTVVKFKSFEDIDEVRFVDDDGDKIAAVNIEELDEVTETEVSFRAVDYDDLADILKDQVDYLKLGKNFKAYEYDDYVYLIATMGKKASSGYSIDIEDLYKVENGSKYTVKAVVETDTTPNNDDKTTYPYSIVKFKLFNNIESVRFVDEDNNKLSEVKIVELDEVTEVKGIITAINQSSRAIRVEKENGSVVTLSIAEDAEITVNDDEDESFSDLVKGMTVEAEVVGDKVTKLVAEDTTKEIKGVLTGISISTEKKITLNVDGSNKTYTVDSNVKIIIDGETARFDDLEISSRLTLKFVNGLLTEIEE